MTENEYVSAVKRNSQRLFALAFSYTKSTHDADDILQNTFIKLWKNKKPFQNDEHIDKWLSRVCVNECKNFLTSPFKKKAVTLDECKNTYSLNKDSDYDLLSAVMQLNKKERIVIHLFYFEEYKITEIAALLNTKESTVKSRLLRAKTHLKQILGDEYNE